MGPGADSWVLAPCYKSWALPLLLQLVLRCLANMSFTLEHHYFGPSSYRRARPASVSSSGFHSQRRRLTYSQPPSVDNVDTFNGDMTRRSEKEILQSLNDRFAGYIDKVRSLEMHNRNLEAEAAALRQSQTGRASVGEHYERELGDLRALLQQLSGERARAALEQEHLEEDIQHVRARLEDEARNREELEAASRAMKKYGEECRLARLELDKKLRALEEESAFLKKNHEEEVSELLAQIQGAQVNFDVQETLKTDITTALREIRAQLDNHTSKTAMHAEEWFKGEWWQKVREKSVEFCDHSHKCTKALTNILNTSQILTYLTFIFITVEINDSGNKHWMVQRHWRRPALFT